VRAKQLFQPIVAVAIASIGTIATLSVAANAPQDSVKPKPSENWALKHEAYVMMGDIQVADVDLMNGYAQEASRHINQAMRLSKKVEQQTAQVNSAAIKAGHLQYSDTNGHKHDYWLPVVNGRMVVNNLSESFGRGVKPLQAADEAQLVTVSTSIDVKAIHDDLEKAAMSLAANDDTHAQAALREAEQNVFTEQLVQTAPLASAHDNLLLARDLLSSRDYKAAGAALRHARASLKDYEMQQKEQTKTAHVEKIQSQIDQLQTKLSQGRPTTALAKAEHEIDHWMADIRTI
jgi:YfdX protein